MTQQARQFIGILFPFSGRNSVLGSPSSFYHNVEKNIKTRMVSE